MINIEFNSGPLNWSTWTRNCSYPDIIQLKLDYLCPLVKIEFLSFLSLRNIRFTYDIQNNSLMITSHAPYSTVNNSLLILNKLIAYLELKIPIKEYSKYILYITMLQL